MSYCLVQDDTIVEGPGPLPDVWNDGTRDWDLRPMSDAELADLGWLPVTEVPRPSDTETTTHDYSVQVVDGVPSEVWTERPKTPEEIGGRRRHRRTRPRWSPSRMRRSTNWSWLSRT